MKNKFTTLKGTIVCAEFSGGLNASGEHVDYMRVKIGDVGLYAEIPSLADTDYDEPNCKAFEVLGNKINELAKEKGIDLDWYNPIFG